MRKQPEITNQTRKNIITAFCRLYENKPIQQIYVKDIISLAGYNRSTFYEYFSDVYSLLNYIEDDVIDYIKSGLKSSTHTQKELFYLLDKKEEYLKVLLGPYGCIHFQDRLKNEFMSENILPNNARLSSYLSEFHITVSLSMYRLWISKNKNISLDELSELIHTLYNSGVQGILNKNTI